MINTVSINQQNNYFDDSKELWLFGYGSLIYKVDFPILDRSPATITGWKRRFWQGSHDHRGTPDSPGRVVTLLPAEKQTCAGMAYLITPEVFAHLDYREKNGYLRCVVPIDFKDGRTETGLVYIATAENEAFLGEASHDSMAQQIATSIGPSGRNSDYLFQLAEALRGMQADDSHVFQLEKKVKAILLEAR